MAAVCTWVVRIVGALYLVALALLVIGTFGLFGQEQDPLSGVYLMPLGMPWVLWTGELPDPFLPWAAVLAPLLNIAILAFLCRRIRDGHARRQ